jgi:hypothetical protein
MYNLDFETIKLVMREHRATGYLYANVSTGIGGLQGPCRIHIRLSKGEVTSCAVVGINGQQLPEKEAVSRLTRLGRLQWEFVAQGETEPVLPFSPIQDENSLFPQRTVYLDQRQMQSWPRLHRSVFALADGTRSSVKIAEMLSVGTEVVERVLRDLQLQGMVVMGPNTSRNYRNGREH